MGGSSVLFYACFGLGFTNKVVLAYFEHVVIVVVWCNVFIIMLNGLYIHSLLSIVVPNIPGKGFFSFFFFFTTCHMLYFFSLN